MTANEIFIALFWVVTASYGVYLGWNLYTIIRRATSPTKENSRSSERLS